MSCFFDGNTSGDVKPWGKEKCPSLPNQLSIHAVSHEHSQNCHLLTRWSPGVGKASLKHESDSDPFIRSTTFIHILMGRNLPALPASELVGGPLCQLNGPLWTSVAWPSLEVWLLEMQFPVKQATSSTGQPKKNHFREVPY